MGSLLEMTLTELVETLRARHASPVELMRETLDAVDRHNPTLNALVASRDRDTLLEEAAEAERRIGRGEARPLEGIPFGVKDLEDVAGLVTSHGSKPFRDNVAQQDSTQVARLRAAGAIAVGKTNAPEFGRTAITKNMLYGVTGSPWDPARTPGGSSGGSASALAAEMLPLVTSNDGGGSVRIPASFVGAFGLKPSYGRVPKGPLEQWEYGATTVPGPITKTVEDAAWFLDQVAGHDAFDPTSLPHPGIRYADAVREPLPKGLRIAYAADLGTAVVQSDIAEMVERAMLTFEELGHHVERIEGGPPEMAADWGLLGAYETGGRLAPLRPDHESEISRALMEVIRMAEGMTQELWGKISARRAELVRWCAELFARYDLLVTPTVPYDPPPAKGPFPSETEGRPQPTASAASFTIPFNLSWHPAATVRAGLSREGFPVGMHIVGPHHRDERVLQAARAFEQRHPWHPHWPLRSSDDS